MNTHVRWEVLVNGDLASTEKYAGKGWRNALLADAVLALRKVVES